ncbi:MAG: SurA N-terminal domain-containing protein [Anaerolineales bacterium]|nr:SurA N-terminal domain-containing protein [Anaerolineales bacterium]
MAKRIRRIEQEKTVQTPKDLARSRREKKARRQTLLAIGGVSAVIVIILLVGIVLELMIKPGQPVAIVNGTEITTNEFQEQVRLQRAQTINLIYQYADLLGVEQVYGAAAQLDEYEAIGEQVLDSMIEEILIRQGAAELGISVSEDRVSIYLEEIEGYYREGTPTPRPTSTPWPTSTPISPTLVTATPAPTRTPYPSPTVVTEDSFQDTYNSQIADFRKDGVKEATYRKSVQLQLLIGDIQEKLMEDVPDEVEQAQLDMLVFTTEESATAYFVRMVAGETFDILAAEASVGEDETVRTTSTSWMPIDELASRWGNEVANMAFSLQPGDYSEILSSVDDQFVIFRLAGLEVRELSASSLSTLKETYYNKWLEGLKEKAAIEKIDYWRNRVPTQPAVDQRSLIPTATTILTPTPSTEE